VTPEELQVELNWTNEDLKQCQVENIDLRDQIRHYEAEYKKLRAALDEERAKVEKPREALEQISRAEGAFSRDPLTHAENVIHDAVDTALSALAALEATDE